MAEKQMIVVVEGTAAIGPYWASIVSDYLEKIIRSFCGNELTGQKLPAANAEFSLVVFNAHGSYSACLVQRSGWTRNVDIFLQWLSAISFTGGGFSDVAIAEGLSEALMMFPLPPSGTGAQNVDGHKHCILIAASNPYPLPTPVYRPKIPKMEQSENNDVSAESCLADAETVAKSFAKCSLSLSVISPKQLLKLRAIYTAGKRNPRVADPVVDNIKNPYFLVLLSENFMEARNALSRSGITNITSNQSPVKMDTSIPQVSGPPPTSVNGLHVNRQSVPLGNLPTATVKVEPSTLTSLASGPAFGHLPSVSHGASQSIPTLHTSSPSSTSQEVTTNGDNVQEFKPVVNVTSPPPGRKAIRSSPKGFNPTWSCNRLNRNLARSLLSLALKGLHYCTSENPSRQRKQVRTHNLPSGAQLLNLRVGCSSLVDLLIPIGSSAANVNILNNLSQVRSASLTGASSMGLQTMGGTPVAMHMSNMISSGMVSSALPAAQNVFSSAQSGITSISGSGAVIGSAQVTQSTTLGSFPSATSNLSANSNHGVSQPLNNLQGVVGIGQPVPGMNQGNNPGAQIGQNGIAINQNVMNSLGPSISSGGGTMIPTPGMSQGGMQSIGVANSSTANMPLPQQTLPQQTAGGMQTTPAKYVKVWEGALSGQRQGQPVFITKLEGYRSASASETLAADWPLMMQIVRLISQDHMNNKQYVGKADFLVFRALNHHGFLGQLQEKKLCAVIQLPSQTLLLSVSDKASRLIGMLFPGVRCTRN
ncbi:hypothetical protein IFM89_011602 [Coptis chinensis]|uniref:Mediator of RNA polymerase II transcription subunit 25 n=1 Tax=Coptis chinensis TaxID=261450 RepID=A0A835H2Y7_9MAGN|nr:hypothetical protein IFM89_011602 [Coptis chinensis]